MPARRHEVPDEHIRDLCFRYKSGGSLEQLAVEFGLTVTIVRRVLVENDVTIRGRGRPRKNSGN